MILAISSSTILQTVTCGGGGRGGGRREGEREREEKEGRVMRKEGDGGRGKKR